MTVYGKAQKREMLGNGWQLSPVASIEPLTVEIDATPAAIKLAAQNGIDLTTVTGSGTDGRILKSDIEALI